MTSPQPGTDPVEEEVLAPATPTAQGLPLGDEDEDPDTLGK
ncbi:MULTISPECIES: hypothetical protein [Mycobacterium]|nr:MULTISPECIES: hypothetical protein [Mycobacterium]